MNNIIAVTMGDPAGIDPEVIIKSLSEAGLAGAPMVAVGCVRMLRRTAAINITPQTELRVIQKVCNIYFALDVISVMDKPLTNPDALTPGVVQAAAGDSACRCIKRITAPILLGEVKVITTTPLDKEALHLGGYNYPGHTELSAHLTGSKEYAMVLYTGKLKVIHISAHISLRKFLDILDGEGVRTVIRAANRFLKRVGIGRPRIVVAGINPRAGEYGLFGTEEIEIIAPAIKIVQVEDIGVTDPYPPDTVFMQYHEGLFDMVVAMHHDQGYIPLKLSEFYDRVNITVGLPLIRTSTDRGITLDIAWTGKARSESMAVSI